MPNLSNHCVSVNYFCTSSGERLPLEGLEFLESFERTESGLSKTREEWLLSSGGRTYESKEILSLSLSREILLLIKPVKQPDFSLVVLPPEYSAFHAFLSFLSRILGVFRQGH